MRIWLHGQTVWPLRLGPELNYAKVKHPKYGMIYAYETDGLETKLMDDANIPSLLSIPYLGYCDAADPVYQTHGDLS